LATASIHHPPITTIIIKILSHRKIDHTIPTIQKTNESKFHRPKVTQTKLNCPWFKTQLKLQRKKKYLVLKS